jgi:hypothetical protein
MMKLVLNAELLTTLRKVKQKTEETTNLQNVRIAELNTLSIVNNYERLTRSITQEEYNEEMDRL